nr:hypothetical protein Iba_chr14aCG27450 [Ipomoea batatas]
MASNNAMPSVHWLFLRAAGFGPRKQNKEVREALAAVRQGHPRTACRPTLPKAVRGPGQGPSEDVKIHIQLSSSEMFLLHRREASFPFPDYRKTAWKLAFSSVNIADESYSFRDPTCIFNGVSANASESLRNADSLAFYSKPDCRHGLSTETTFSVDTPKGQSTILLPTWAVNSMLIVHVGSTRFIFVVAINTPGKFGNK